MADNFERDLNTLYYKLISMEDEIPRETIKKAVKAATVPLLKEIRAHAPMRTGALRNGMIVRMENEIIDGVIWYDVKMDPKKNRIFQAEIVNPVYCTENYGRRYIAYYPASMEYGYPHRVPIDLMGRPLKKLTREPGRHFMRGGADVASDAAKSIIVQTLCAEIDKYWYGL